jgi:hypothetical protein
MIVPASAVGEVIKQVGRLLQRAAASETVRTSASRATSEVLAKVFQKVGFGPTGAQGLSRVINEIALRDADGRLRPQVVDAVRNTAQSARRWFARLWYRSGIP